MPDLRKYWAEVREIERGLAEFVWLVAVAGGFPMEAGRGQAAKLLRAGSHRVATEEEVRAERDRQEGKRVEGEEEVRRRKGVAVVEVG